MLFCVSGVARFFRYISLRECAESRADVEVCQWRVVKEEPYNRFCHKPLNERYTNTQHCELASSLKII